MYSQYKPLVSIGLAVVFATAGMPLRVGTAAETGPDSENSACGPSLTSRCPNNRQPQKLGAHRKVVPNSELYRGSERKGKTPDTNESGHSSNWATLIPTLRLVFLQRQTRLTEELVLHNRRFLHLETDRYRNSRRNERTWECRAIFSWSFL